MAKPIRHREMWRIRWIDENGRRRSEVFADYKSAAHKLREHEVRVEEVARGIRSPEVADKSFDDLCTYWIAKRVPQKRSGKDDESMIRRHLRPAFGHLRLRAFGVSHADAFMIERAHLHKKTIHNLLTLTITMLNAAKDLGWLSLLPRIRKPKVRAVSTDFAYLRTDAEVRRFLDAAQVEEERIAMLYACAVYTGMRAGELAALRWSDVDFDRRLITVQRSFDGPTKAEDVRYVPILDPLLPALRGWRLKNPLALVFPNELGTMHGESARVFQEAFHRVLTRAQFPSAVRGKKTRSYIRFHDLRHTFASLWMVKGGDLFRLQKILGHKESKMTLRYAHLAPDAYTDDHGRFGTRPAFAIATVVLLPAQTG